MLFSSITEGIFVSMGVSVGCVVSDELDGEVVLVVGVDCTGGPVDGTAEEILVVEGGATGTVVVVLVSCWEEVVEGVSDGGAGVEDVAIVTLSLGA